MATADQVIALVSSHYSNDSARFDVVAKQILAHEQGNGNIKVARALESVVRRAESRRVEIVHLPCPDIVTGTKPTAGLDKVELSDEAATQLRQVVREQKCNVDLRDAGMSPAWRVLLVGPPGTGKTMTASALAAELDLPLFRIRPDGLLRSYLGETQQRLGKVFDAMKGTRGVYLFDEFDGIGNERGGGKDIGEIDRVVTALLQFLERDDHDSIVVCATNHPKSLDRALARRFDALVRYQLPTGAEIARIIAAQMGDAADAGGIERATAHALGLSHAEVVEACRSVKKAAILSGSKVISVDALIDAVRDRLSGNRTMSE